MQKHHHSPGNSCQFQAKCTKNTVSKNDNILHRVLSQSSIVIEVPNVVLSRCMPRCSVSLGKQKDALQKMPCCDITYVEISKMKLVHTWTWNSVANHHFFYHLKQSSLHFQKHHHAPLKMIESWVPNFGVQCPPTGVLRIRQHPVSSGNLMRKYAKVYMPKYAKMQPT